MADQPRETADFPVPAPLSSHGPARVIALCNQKGGVGKTTSTINIAASLAEYGRKVLVVDFDPQGALSAGLGVHANDKTIYNLLFARDLLPTDVIVATAVPNLDLLPANIDLSAAEMQLVSEIGREKALKRVLDKVADSYDVILIDCQPSLGLLTVNALTAAHGVLIPLACEFFALRGVALLLDIISKVRDSSNEALKIDGVLATMYDPRTLHSKEVLELLQKQFSDQLLSTQISRTVKFPDASVAAAPMTTFAPDSAAAASYRSVARELVSRGCAP